MSRHWCSRVVCVAITLGLAPAAIGATCESLGALDIPYATITTAQTVPAGSFHPPSAAAITNLPEFCRVALTMAPSFDSSIRVEVWLPFSAWSGRFRGLGGGGYTGSVNYGALGTALRAGDATANTDMGTAPASGGNGTALVGHAEK